MSENKTAPARKAKVTLAKPQVKLCRSCKEMNKRGDISSLARQPERCTVCHRCGGCGCACRRCSKCGKQKPGLTPFFCRRCSICSGCCGCRSMPHYSPPSAKVLASPALVNQLPRTLGMELELSNWGTIARPGANFKHLKYTPSHDWSVQPSGQEMVLEPLRGDAFLRAMFELAGKLATSGASVNDTCAYHVHVGASDLSFWELRRLLRVYLQIEQEIYDYLILPHRRDVPRVTHYCQMLTKHHEECERCDRYDNQYPRQRRSLMLLGNVVAQMDQAKTTTDLKAVVARMLYNINVPKGRIPHQTYVRPFEELQTRKGGKYEWCRYVGLNLHAWMYRGTIEFRMKEGVTELSELTNWPLWCGWFVQATQVMREKESREPWGLSDFTRRFMPGFVSEWVDGKIREVRARKPGEGPKVEVYVPGPSTDGIEIALGEVASPSRTIRGAEDMLRWSNMAQRPPTYLTHQARNVFVEQQTTAINPPRANRSLGLNWNGTPIRSRDIVPEPEPEIDNYDRNHDRDIEF